MCPPDASPCVVPQPNGTSFCQECPSFCSTCSSASNGAAVADATTPTTDQSGLSTGAIIGIVAAAILLLLVLVAASWWALTRTRSSKPVIGIPFISCFCVSRAVDSVSGKKEYTWPEA
ncbi:unnamed protein product [Closterium sp. NIES-54]